MFPPLDVTVKGLDPLLKYNIQMRVAPADKYRHKYDGMRWEAAGESDVQQDMDRQIVSHSRSPDLGQSWMKAPVSFRTVKLTHFPSSRYGNVS